VLQSSLPRLIQPSRDGAHRLLQWRKISLNDLPDRLKVHSKVIVHEDVAHSGNRSPVDFGVLQLVLIVDTLG